MNFRDNEVDMSLPMLLFKLVQITLYFLPIYQVNRTRGKEDCCNGEPGLSSCMTVKKG